jgi:hypothetical protein
VRVERQRSKAEMAGEMAMRGAAGSVGDDEGKKIIKGEGQPASVNREREACGRPCSLWFFPTGRGGTLEKKMGLGLGIFSDVVKIAPPEKNQCSLVFIGKVLLGFQTSPSTFPFLLFSSFL